MFTIRSKFNDLNKISNALHQRVKGFIFSLHPIGFENLPRYSINVLHVHEQWNLESKDSVGNLYVKIYIKCSIREKIH